MWFMCWWQMMAISRVENEYENFKRWLHISTVITRLQSDNIPLNYMKCLFVGKRTERWRSSKLLSMEDWFIINRLPKILKSQLMNRLFFSSEFATVISKQKSKNQNRFKKNGSLISLFRCYVCISSLSDLWRCVRFSSRAHLRCDFDQWFVIKYSLIVEIKLNEITLVLWINVKFPNQQQQ